MSRRFVLALALLAGSLQAAEGGELPDWTAKIRDDHPRLFFNRDTWPQVRQRALGAERAWYEENPKPCQCWHLYEGEAGELILSEKAVSDHVVNVDAKSGRLS